MATKEELGYYWYATFEDASTASQFTGETENPFSDVLDSSSPVEEFKIISADDSKEFVIDLVGQTITDYNSNETSVTGTNPSLVYFRRNSVRLELGTGEVLDPTIVHHVGIHTDSNDIKFQVFAGIGMKPERAELNDNGDISNITE